MPPDQVGINLSDYFHIRSERDPDQLRALENGADDYITKPFAYDIVIAKIHSQLRRVYGDYAAKIRRAYGGEGRAGPVSRTDGADP